MFFVPDAHEIKGRTTLFSNFFSFSGKSPPDSAAPGNFLFWPLLFLALQCKGYDAIHPITTQATNICYITNSEFQSLSQWHHMTSQSWSGLGPIKRKNMVNWSCWPLLVVWAAVRNGFWLSKEANDVSDDGDYELLVHCAPMHTAMLTACFTSA